LVVRLQVDDPDAVELAQLSEQLPVPVLLRVELELELGSDGEPALRSRSGRDDETGGTLLAPERLAEPELALPKREIQGGALERPAPIALAQLLEVVEPVGE